MPILDDDLRETVAALRDAFLDDVEDKSDARYLRLRPEAREARELHDPHTVRWESRGRPLSMPTWTLDVDAFLPRLDFGVFMEGIGELPTDLSPTGADGTAFERNAYWQPVFAEFAALAPLGIAHPLPASEPERVAEAQVLLNRLLALSSDRSHIALVLRAVLDNFAERDNTLLWQTLREADSSFYDQWHEGDDEDEEGTSRKSSA